MKTSASSVCCTQSAVNLSIPMVTLITKTNKTEIYSNSTKHQVVGIVRIRKKNAKK